MLIPKSSSLTAQRLREMKITDYWDKDWWQKSVVYDDIYPKLKDNLPNVKWVEEFDDLKAFGNDETNDISISFLERKYIDNFRVRIDLSNLDFQFIDLILLIAQNLGCYLADRKHNLFNPTREDLFEAMKESNAQKFTKDPRKFLDDLSKGKVDNE
jgi:hypothetical protein